MFSWRKPSDAVMQQLAERLQSESLTYDSPDGCPPPGFVDDRLSVILGSGPASFDAARRAIQNWKMFPSVMAGLWPSRPSIQPGEIVHVLFRAGPLWTTNSCRILRVIDEAGETARFGFVYGTLPGHVERGEETFVVEWDRPTDVVTYSLRAFSQPAHWLVWLGYPYTRLQQARFRRLSGQSMQAAVQTQANT